MLKKDSSQAVYEAALPDSSVWENTAMATLDYLNSPLYRFFPVVGVSYAQAKAYCKWRENVLNHHIRQKNPKKFPNYYTLRLPTEAEWERAAQTYAGVVHSKEKKKVAKDFGEKLKEEYPEIPFSAEEIQAQEEAYFASGAFTPAFNCKPFLTYPEYRKHLPQEKKPPLISVYADLENQLGMYNMLGNVAEWVEEGYAKGGSWQHEMEECLPHQKQEVEKPTNWLGFRCVGELQPRTGEQGEENP
jgi:formylglycine-generating enzyme required for sulfatase activity